MLALSAVCETRPRSTIVDGIFIDDFNIKVHAGFVEHAAQVSFPNGASRLSSTSF